jgi:hypothetical protein
MTDIVKISNNTNNIDITNIKLLLNNFNNNTEYNKCYICNKNKECNIYSNFNIKKKCNCCNIKNKKLKNKKICHDCILNI